MKQPVLLPLQETEKLVDLVTKLRAKHVAEGDASPLKVFDWDTLNPLLDQALDQEQVAARLKRETLNAFQQRKLKRRNLIAFVRKSRDILTGMYDQEMKVLGLWGFHVIDNRSTSPPKKDDNPAPGEI